MPPILDFTELPSDSLFEARSVLTEVSKPLAARLASLPEVQSRLRSSVMFAEESSKQSEPWRAAAHLRAALAEYCSIEEMQKVDKPKPSLPPLRVDDLANPLLHLLELMRHLNIHVKSISAARHSLEVSWGDQAFSLDVYVVADLDPKDLVALKNGKHYLVADLEAMVDWFTKVQAYWGAGYVLRIGAEELGEQICAHYGL